MPELPIRRIGWRRPSQPLKSPTTETPPAVGAQTANAVPAVPPWNIGWAPSRSQGRSCRPSLRR
jgi:hypothetical protein